MSVDLRVQSLSLLLACALGAALGLLYDLMRPVRRHGSSTLWDVLFCLCAASGAFLYAMRSPGGMLGTAEILLCGLGLLSYFHLLSPFCLPLFVKLDRAIGAIWIFTQNLGKKVALSAKKLFQNSSE